MILRYPVALTLLLLSAAACSTPAMAEDLEEDLFHFFDEFKHECVRNCSADPGPRECRYRIRLEWFMTMSKACFDCPRNLTDCFRPHCITGDGVERALLSVNRQLSGPGIHVCEGDTVIAEVHNFMEMGEGTSVHWHGMHQVGTQHMDGVSMVTQCPINAHSSFTYRFAASPAGTHYWHSHSGLQRSEGIFGPLVVRQAADPHAGLYDTDQPEHTLLLSDWFHELGATKFAAHHYSNGDNKPKGLIINGRGAFAPSSAGGPQTPRYVLRVRSGLRHRVRVISNAILNCPFVLSVANHSLLVIATDGAPVVPIEVDSLIIYAGERFDFVLTADRPPGNYLLMVAGLADCDSRFTMARQSAIVSYAGIDETPLQGAGNPAYSDMLGRPGGRQLNPFNRAPDANHIDVTSLRTPAGWPPADHLTVDGPVDAKFYLAFDFEVVNNSRYHHPAYYPISAVRKSDGHLYTPQINNVALHMPPAPLLYQFDDVLQSHICNNTDFDPSLETEFKACHHALRLGVNKTVELVLIDKGFTFDASHPFHLHGHFFRVIGMEKLGKNVSVAEVKRRDSAGLLRRNLDRPVMKDTVIVPDGGYTVLRFRTDNPGVWLLHCHLEFHVEIGMGLLLLVGDAASWSAGVPANFPRCGSWKGPGPDRRWQQRELRLAETHRLHMTALGLAAAGAVLLAALLSVFLTRRFGLRSNPVQNIETVSEAVSYGSLKAPQLTF
ncbi:hypothetical protein BOX15_Mlig012506g2 [Macrostomum lignano]|uniref:Plastocyanin-like domain-containing protein n=1 Tax=Macrostomum lignano TaxID=282301 RepID=A0A267EAG1_9PLAT|nr:hypothetical protein BOX15_Mlig012506g2 [Macrostomum lignano]